MASPIANTFSVWHGLFLRETLDRFFGCRMAWAWLIFEPVIHMSLIAVYVAARRGSGGVGTNLPVLEWLIVGLMVFFFFRRAALQTQHSVDSNKAFFAFRQVKPNDVALVRSTVEAFSMFLIATMLALVGIICGYKMIPHDPLIVIVVCLLVWALATGYGMITCVIMRLVPETGHLFMVMMMPLYILSGTIIPLAMFPASIREILMYNPMAHALELARSSFFYPYHSMNPSLSYLAVWSVSLLLTGLLMFKLFHKRLIER